MDVFNKKYCKKGKEGKNDGQRKNVSSAVLQNNNK